MPRFAGRASQALCLSHSSVDITAHSTCFACLCHGIPFLKAHFNVCILFSMSKHVNNIEIKQLVGSTTLFWNVRRKLRMSKRVEELYNQV